MTSKEKDDLFYVCSLIEFTARKTKNKRGVIIDALGKGGIQKQLSDASVNHCLSFEQVSDEIIEEYKIPEGNFDTITDSKYSIPGVQAIGKVYRQLILDTAEKGQEVNGLINVFKSFISDEISDFSTNVYYSNPSYLKYSYEEGMLLD